MKLSPKIITALTTASLTGCIAVAQQPPQIMFDDFSYATVKDANKNGWNTRTEIGHPGISGAIWWDTGVTFHKDDSNPNNQLMRLSSQTDGTAKNTRHTQICHARKYLEGTYAARVFFRDEPTFGPDGDEVIQTFYAISPLEAPMDPAYSETDFEYLPNGGWSAGSEPAFWSTTWETFQLTPWTKVNENTRKEGSYAGWQTLVLTVKDDKVSYYINGELLSIHSEKVAPEVAMSMNFNLWFMPKGENLDEGPVDSSELRQYQEDIDWVFHQKGVALTTQEVQKLVNDMRSNNVTFTDTVPENNPVLSSPCGL
jgi:hypothetical protein